MNAPGADIIYRPALPDDSETIVAIARRSLPEAVTAISVLQSPGYTLCIRDRITREADTVRPGIVVADLDSRPCAMAEFHWSDEAGHLNYIAVDETARGRGVGGGLLRFGLQGRGMHTDLMTLDVFEDNATAVSWYRGLGFVETGRKTWSEFSLDGLVPGSLDGVAVHPDPGSSGERYGFSMIEMHADDDVYSIGIPGPKRFRLLDAAALGDPRILAALVKIGAGKTVVVAHDAPLPEVVGARARRLGDNLRMAAPMADLTAALGIVDDGTVRT